MDVRGNAHERHQLVSVFILSSLTAGVQSPKVAVSINRFAIYPSRLPPGVSTGTPGPSGYRLYHFSVVYDHGAVFAFHEFAETSESIKKWRQ